MKSLDSLVYRLFLLFADKQLSEAYENRNRDLSVSWDEFLELNHDVLHALARGEVVRAPGVRLA